MMPNDATWTTSVRWSPEIDQKLTRMVEQVLASRGKTSRSEVLAAIVASQDPGLEHVNFLLDSYREQLDPERAMTRRSRRRRRPGPVAMPQTRGKHPS